MTLEEIAEFQAQAGLSQLQEWINTGAVWYMKADVGNAAMKACREGACMLPDEEHLDYFKNWVPARWGVVAGSSGSLENCIRYWSNPANRVRAICSN
jgi:hypothetical protein